MYRSNRIILLNERFKDLIKDNLYVNCLGKCLSQSYQKRIGTNFNSVLESSVHLGSTITRKNKFYTSVPFEKNWRGVTLFIDEYITAESLKWRSDFNVALLLETKYTRPESYSNILQLHEYFDLILTYDQDLIKKLPNKARYVNTSTPTLSDPFFGLNLSNKRFPISHIFSEKRETKGQQLRHTLAHKFEHLHPHPLHLLGPGADKLRRKEKGEMIAPYLFSMAIESSIINDYMTEQIFDCFISGTIPIYWGCPSVGEYFDSSGIISFNEINELEEIFNKIIMNPFKLYQSMAGAIINNYEFVKRYLYIDDLFLLEILDFLSYKGRLEEILPMLKHKNVFK